MKSFEDFSRERVSMIISLNREGISQSAVLPWDADAEELIGTFVRMLWVAEYPPSWFPEILRDLADAIETDLNPEKGELEAKLAQPPTLADGGIVTLEFLRELNNQAKQQADETRGEER